MMTKGYMSKSAIFLAMLVAVLIANRNATKFPLARRRPLAPCLRHY